MADTNYGYGGANFTAQLASLFASNSAANRELDVRQQESENSLLALMLSRDARIAEVQAQNQASIRESQAQNAALALAKEESAYRRLDRQLEHQLKLAEASRADRDAAFDKALKLKQAGYDSRLKELQLQQLEDQQQIPYLLGALHTVKTTAEEGSPSDAHTTYNRIMAEPAMQRYMMANPTARQGLEALGTTLLQMTDKALFNVETGENLNVAEHVQELSSMDFDKLQDGHGTLRQIQVLSSIQHGIGKDNPTKAEVLDYLRAKGVTGSNLSRFEQLPPERYAALFAEKLPVFDRNAVIRGNRLMMTIDRADQENIANGNPLFLADPEAYENMRKAVQRTAVGAAVGLSARTIGNMEPNQVDLRSHLDQTMAAYDAMQAAQPVKTALVTPKYERERLLSEQTKHIGRLEGLQEQLSAALNTPGGNVVEALAGIAAELERYNEFDPGWFSPPVGSRVRASSPVVAPSTLSLAQLLSASKSAEIQARMAMLRASNTPIANSPEELAIQLQTVNPRALFFRAPGQPAAQQQNSQFDYWTTSQGSDTAGGS